MDKYKEIAEKATSLRLDIDRLYDICKNQLQLKIIIERGKYVGEKTDSYNINSSEVNNCSASLLLAKAWLGKFLGELNIPSPYINDGKRNDVADIEPTDAKAPPLTAAWNEHYSHTKKVDEMRENIGVVIKDVKTITDFCFNEMSNFRITVSAWEVEKHLSEARIHLGFELQRIRESNTQKKQ